LIIYAIYGITISLLCYMYHYVIVGNANIVGVLEDLKAAKRSINLKIEKAVVDNLN